MTHDLLAFDIETKPNYAMVQELNHFAPDQSVFDPANVKVGNLKDQTKIDEKIAKAEADFESELEEKETEFWAKLNDKAALHPLTLTVVAIGFMDKDNGTDICHSVAEAEILKFFWARYTDIMRGSARRKEMVGWNIEGFDIARIIQRSIILGVYVPSDVMNGHYYNKIFRDLMKMFGCHQHGSFYGLTNVAKCMGLAQPREHEIQGKNFWKHLENDTENALQYLKDDLLETYAVADRIFNNV